MSTSASPGQDPTTVLGYLFKHAHQQFDAATTTALAPFGIDPRSFGVLRVLAGGEPTSQQDVARVLGVDRTTMVAHIDDLEAKDLVSRHPHPQDRRRNVVELTTSGRAVFAAASKAYADAERDFLGSLDRRGAQQLRDALRTVVVAYSTRTVHSP